MRSKHSVSPAERRSRGEKIFTLFNYVFLTLSAATCLIPLLNQLAISFSTSSSVAAGRVFLIPKEFTLESYRFMAQRPAFFLSLWMSVKRVGIGVPLSLVLTILAAYPLSKENSEFKARKYYIWYYIIPMMFYGGLIPSYIVVRDTGVIDTVWALVLPCAINVFNILLMMNFFRGLPREMEEAATIDGAGHMRVLCQIVLPVSAPVLATVTLFFIVNHWNSWFDGLIYMNQPERYPLQTYLQTMVISKNLTTMDSLRDVRSMANVSDRTGKAAQIFLAAAPVLVVYPFLQKYFTTGIVMGSVKG